LTPPFRLRVAGESSIGVGRALLATPSVVRSPPWRGRRFHLIALRLARLGIVVIRSGGLTGVQQNETCNHSQQSQTTHGKVSRNNLFFRPPFYCEMPG